MNYKLITIFLILLISSLTLCQGADVIENPTSKPLIPIAEYEKIVPKTDSSLTDTVYVMEGASTMDVKTVDGNIRITDSVHTTRDIVFDESSLERNLDGYNGHSVQVFHINDKGVYDYIEIHELVKADGYVYLFDIEFSEVIIDGYVGTWEVTAYNLSVSDSLNLGQEANGSKTEYVHVNVTDDASALSKYDYIESTNPILWLKGDGNANDSSIYGNDGVWSGSELYVNGKYNDAFDFICDGNHVTLPDNLLIDNDSFSISLTVNFSIDNVNSVIYSAGSGTLGGRAIHGFHLYMATTNELRFTVGNGTSGSGSMASYDMDNYGDFLNKKYYIVGIYNNTDKKTYLYINNINVDTGEELQGNFVAYIYNKIGILAYTNAYYANSSIDNVLLYNETLTQLERNNLYYDHLQQLQIKTNSNSTWSTEWNSTADNPIQAIYGDGEFFSLLNFTVPDTVVQNGITIYDYPSTVQLDAIATIGYTEDITKITESAAAGTYILNITHTAANTGEGYINYTTANTVLLDADFWNSAVLTSDNPNATLSSTLPCFNISTGYVAAGTEYYYLVTQDYFYPPTNVQTTPSQTSVYIEWDAVPNADNYSVYELEDGFPYVDTNPVVDGIKDAIYNYSHKFLIFSPNPITVGDYGTIYPVRTSLGAYLLIESVDNDNKLGDDDTIYYFDLDNDGLTVDDPAWKITNNVVKKYEWDGASWKVTGVSNAVGASTGGGTLYPIHELFIPVAELGANWTNGSTVKVLVKREDSALTPDVITWYPYENINNTDTALWQEMVLNDPDSYTWLANTTNLWYNATGLTPFTIYHGGVSAWNGSQETSYGLFDAITEDTPMYNASGYIFDSLGNPIAGATVYSCNGFVHEITTSNASGYWIGYNFRNDTYTVCANATNTVQNSISVTISGANLTNQNITLNYYNFSYTGISCISPIYPDETSTVWVDVTDPDGTIQAVTVKIDWTNYSMHVVNGNQWGYVYSDTSEIKKHHITNFYAWDDQGQINSTTSTLCIDVTTVVSSCARGVVYEVEPELELIPVTVIGDERAKFIINLAGLYDFIIGDEPSKFIQGISEWLQGISDYTLVQHISEVGESKPFWYFVGCLSLGMFLSGVTDKNPKIKAKPAATIGFVGILISSIYLGLFAIVI